MRLRSVSAVGVFQDFVFPSNCDGVSLLWALGGRPLCRIEIAWASKLGPLQGSLTANGVSVLLFYSGCKGVRLQRRFGLPGG